MKTTIGPRRCVVPQRQPSNSSSTSEEGQRPQDVVSLSHSLAANTLTHSVTRESSGTIDDMFGESFNPSDRQIDLRKPALVTSSSETILNENVNRKVQSLVGSTTLTSHDMEWDTTSQAEASNLGACARSKHQNLQSVDSEASLKSEYKASTSLAKVQGQMGEFRNFLNQPASQCSAMGSSCATTTSIRSSSTPMYNATTQVSRCYVESDPNANPHAVSCQGNLPSFRPSSKDSNVEDAPLSEMPASAIDPEVRVKETVVSNQQQCTTELETPVPSSSHGTDGTAKAPLPNELLASVSSQPQKPDKVASSKGTSAPRKRNYDPDLFFKVNGKLYQRLGKIGSGGSSEVHKVISSDCTIYALKKIKLKGRDYATAYGFCQEIGYLKKLKGKTNIIQLIDYEILAGLFYLSF